MAQHIVGRTGSFDDSASSAPSLHSLLLLRLGLGLVTLLGAAMSFFALSWDVQWHTFVGRDRTLTPPHLFLLGGIIVCGIATLADVIIETRWAKRNEAIQKYITPFANSFAAPLGIYVTGYAALNMAIAFPVDQYWHTLYGVDVAIWAPFHIMAIGGLALMALGTVYTLVSVGNLATTLNSIRERRTAYISAIVGMGISLSTFSVLVVEGMDIDKFISLGFTTIDLFPILQGFLLGSLLVAIAYALPWKWAATSVVGAIAVMMVLNQLFVPAALDWLMQVEQLGILAKHTYAQSQISALAVTWPELTIISAVLIDFFIQRAQKGAMSGRQLTIALIIAILIGCIPFDIASPTAVPDTLAALSILGLVLTIVLTPITSYLGIELGRRIGLMMHASER